MTGYKLLLVDDDSEVLNINGEFFKKKGFTVTLKNDAVSAIRYLEKNSTDCIVLDVMMPGLDGFSAFERIRKLTDTPVIFLTGRTEEKDRINGLMLGADDYLSKPCSLEELYLRIMINIRKSKKVTASENILEFPPLAIDLLSHKVTCNSEDVALSNREYDLLVLLARNPGKEMSFEEIAENLYDNSVKEDRKNIMVTASRLRKKLECHVGMENMIETVWGKGYRFRG